jgi:hypothetical protein
MLRRFVLAFLSVLLVSGAAAQAQPPRALSTDDYIAIQQLYARYNIAIDTGDAEGWAATFVPDGVFNNNNRGHDALVQFVKDWRAKRDGANRRHVNSNLLLTPTADGVKGTTYLVLLNIGARPATIAMTGMYDDALVKTAQGWRFKSRVVKSDAPASQTSAR